MRREAPLGRAANMWGETERFAQSLILEMRESRHSRNDSVDAPEIGGGEDWGGAGSGRNGARVWGQSEKGL